MRSRCFLINVGMGELVRFVLFFLFSTLCSFFYLFCLGSGTNADNNRLGYDFEMEKELWDWCYYRVDLL